MRLPLRDLKRITKNRAVLFLTVPNSSRKIDHKMETVVLIRDVRSKCIAQYYMSGIILVISVRFPAKRWIVHSCLFGSFNRIVLSLILIQTVEMYAIA